MTFDKLLNLIRKNNIPTNVKLESDSGWEGGPTEMEGVYYNRTENRIIFTQGYGAEYYCEPEWSLLWKTQTREENINNSICYNKNITLFPFSQYNPYEQLYKDELRKNNEFEQYYGFKESEERYERIHLNQPLFWGIKVHNTDNNRYTQFIGYIGFSIENERSNIEIYIFKDYRRKGYGKIVLQTLVTYAREGRLKIYDKNIQEIRPYIPTQIQAIVREENMASRALMESCGFQLQNGFVPVMVRDYDNSASEDDTCIVCVQYVYK